MSFDILDLTNLSTALGATVIGNRVPLAPHITTVGPAIRMYSDDLQVSRIVSSGVIIPQNFTFEFDVTPIVLDRKSVV